MTDENSSEDNNGHKREGVVEKWRKLPIEIFSNKCFYVPLSL
jgi:hypothetical protein